jgi:transcriptional regulator with GAF, ATPase, and Fis domain
LPDPSNPTHEDQPGHEIYTETEMQHRMRENLNAALHQTGWKIRGSDGAAELLGVKPTTLLARMKKMGLNRPASI